jgi:hypothetical protein
MARAARAIRADLALDRLARARRAWSARRLLSLATRAGDGFYIGLARAQLANAGRPTLLEDQVNSLLEAVGAFFECRSMGGIAPTQELVTGILKALEGQGFLDSPPDLSIVRARLGAPHTALTPRFAPTPIFRPHLARAA